MEAKACDWSGHKPLLEPQQAYLLTTVVLKERKQCAGREASSWHRSCFSKRRGGDGAMDEECNEEACAQPSCAPGPRTVVRDRAAAALAMIWLGIVWMANIPMGIGLVGVAAVVFAAQVARALRGLKVKMFWLLVGAVFAAAGGASWAGILLPDAPHLLVLGGIALLLSLLVRTGLRDADAASAPGNDDGT